MSLVVTPVLTELYKETINLEAHEHHAKTFWLHLLQTEFLTS